MTIDVNTGNDTTDLGFNLLGHIVETINEKPEAEVDGTEALALAFVAWVAGPGQKITAEGLVEIMNAINEQAMIWNDIQDHSDKQRAH